MEEFSWDSVEGEGSKKAFLCKGLAWGKCYEQCMWCEDEERKIGGWDF